VETDRGATFIAGVSKIAEPPLNDLWTIPGEEHLLTEFQASDRGRFQEIDPVAHYHALQIQEFLQAIRAGRPPAVTGEDGRAVVEIFSAIYESNKTGKSVSLPL
jgi:predicted dehydrogenase